LKCKAGFVWVKGSACNQCKKGEEVFNPASRKCTPRKIMDYSRWDVTKNSEKGYFKLPVSKSYKTPLKVPKYEDIRVIISYTLNTFKKPTTMLVKNYFIKPKKKATSKDKKFQSRVKYIKKEWFVPEKHENVIKYTFKVRFLFKIKPEKKFILKIFPVTRNPKYFKNLEISDIEMSYTPYLSNPLLKIRKYKELNAAESTKPGAEKTKTASTSGKGGRAIAKKSGVDMMANAVEDRQGSEISRLDEKLALENLNDMITK